MTNHATDPAGSDTRLNAILAVYMQAGEAGAAPDKQEFMARHPEFAAQLEEFFADKERFDRVAAPYKQAGHGVSGPANDDTEGKSPAALLETPTLIVGTSPISPQVGVRVRYFGDYEVLEEIARGGMGVVYKARQVNLKRIVALKMILAGQLAGAEDVQRFYAEAEAAAKLDHSGIVTIFEVGQHDGLHYFSMAFVEGESLAHQLAKSVMPPRCAAQLLEKVAQAIAYAHIEGVIHRDLKPANILLDKDGQPRVTDFGLAKRVEGNDGLTKTGQILGTPSYMPPEQASGRQQDVGPLADVYALGAILYCAITGRPPFQAATPVDTLLQLLEQEPVRPRQLNAAIPRDLDTICMKCLEKEPRKRYASAQELADELGRFQRGEPIIARPVGRLERGRRWCRRNRLAAGVVATVTALLLFLSVAASVRYVARARLEASARSFVDFLVQGKFTQATERFSDAVKAQTPLETVETSWKRDTGGLGAFQKQGTSVGIEKALKYDVVYVPCLFEKSELIVKVALDADRRVAGYFLLQGELTQRSSRTQLAAFKSSASSVIEKWAKGEIDEARKDFDATMQTAVTAQALRDGWTQMVGLLGPFREQRVVGSDEYAGYDRIYVQCVFEKDSVFFAVAFNSQAQISGLGQVPPGSVPKNEPLNEREAGAEK